MEDSKPKRAKLSSIDIKKASNEGRIVRIKLDDEPTGEWVRVRGRRSDLAEEMQKAVITKAKQDYKANGNRFIPQSYTDQQAERIAFAVALTMDWGDIDEGGQPLQSIEDIDGQRLSFSPENAKKKYIENSIFLDQVDAGIANDSLFTKP